MGRWKKWIVFPVMLAAGVASKADDASSLTGQQLASIAKQGYPLTVNSTVGESTSVEAVLIPYNVAKHVFGVETAKNYIVIEAIVSNHNPQASLIIESLYLDYSLWLKSLWKAEGQISNSNQASTAQDATQQQSGQQAPDNPPGGKDNDSANGSGLCTNGVPPGDASASQRLTCPAQIASAEYRVVRAELLDRQPFTGRNLFINGATAVGSIATGFLFPFSSDVVRGVNAWNGAFVPAATAMLPDSTVNQLNHISDLGFQTNKVIPKQSSDIVVAFFPIDRLLTKNLAKIYRDDPAVFFVTDEIMLDPKRAKQILKLVEELFPELNSRNKEIAAANLQTVLFAKCDTKDQPTPTFMPAKKATISQSDACNLHGFLQNASLTNIQIGMGGDMTVSTSVVPPTITEVDLQADGKDLKSDTDFWTTKPTEPGSVATGSIIGTYLGGGAPEVVDSQGNSIPNLAVKATSGATDTKIPIQLTLSACLTTTPIEIYFKVTKQASATTAATPGSSGAESTNKISSMLYDYGKVANGCPKS